MLRWGCASISYLSVLEYSAVGFWFGLVLRTTPSNTQGFISSLGIKPGFHVRQPPFLLFTLTQQLCSWRCAQLGCLLSPRTEVRLQAFIAFRLRGPGSPLIDQLEQRLALSRQTGREWSTGTDP